MELPVIYPILNVTPASTEAWGERMLRAFLEAGIDLIQLRVKGLTDRAFLDWAKFCRSRCSTDSCRLLINDRADIAELCGADGVHLGQTDLHPSLVRKSFRSDFIIGYSCHSRRQIEDTTEFRDQLNYLALGPIFTTQSKANPDPVVGLEILSSAREELRSRHPELPLVAIGGIGLDTIREVRACGADSVAMISAFTEIDSVESRVQEALALAT